MKRRIAILIILFLTATLTACGLFPTFPTTTTSAATTASATATTLSPTTLSSATHSSTTTTEWVLSTLPTTTMTTATTVRTDAQPFVPSGYSLLQDELDYVGIPATGDVKLLVFVIDFADASLAASGVTLADVDAAFNGAAADTAWESLASFYDKSSYGKLSLEADIFAYHAAETVAYYENDWLEYYTESDLIYEMMTYYDGTIDYSDYDANADGYVDGVYVLYTAPVSYEFGSDLWWAYQDYYYYVDEDYFDGVTPNYFCWSGTDFLLEAGSAGVDAHTLIHETGHMLGLDDYYDYDDADAYNAGGVGGADMMDYAVGDHSAISKILLGWVTPLVVTASMTVDLAPFVADGETILVIDEWRGTIFDEYLLITYYTPTELNAYDNYYVFTIPGVLIHHVDARIGEGYIEDSAYWTIFNYNNSDTPHKFLKIVEADENGRIPYESWCEDGDLFQAGDVFRQTIESGYQWYQATRTMDFTVAIVAVGDTAVLTFTFSD